MLSVALYGVPRWSWRCKSAPGPPDPAITWNSCADGENMTIFGRLSVGGLRGFTVEQSVDFAKPDGRPGSGLTLLLGANNAGKSTIIEALRAVAGAQAPSFSMGRRNISFGDSVAISLVDDRGDELVKVKSNRPGGSETSMEGAIPSGELFVVQSRRSFSALFGGYGAVTREGYLRDYNPQETRLPTIDSLAARLFSIDRDDNRRARFQAMMKEIIDPVPEWSIDRSDNGQYFLRYRWPGIGGAEESHSSEGLGDGLTSLLSIIDALYDSEPGMMVVVDEPELSLHPEYQRKLMRLLVKLSADRQIVCATHSPYFISWEAIESGATIVRMRRTEIGCRVFVASAGTLLAVARSVHDLNNPHTLGLQANEVFFLHDGVILVEGQEDVVILERLTSELGIALPGSFFGWGVGGAAKMRAIAQLLSELGYETVLGILDNDKQVDRDALANDFPEYHFECIAANDIRTKPSQGAREERPGLVDSGGRLRQEYRGDTESLLLRSRDYLAGEAENGSGSGEEEQAERASA